ncbi:MAG: ABC transporter permease, partial [Acidothermales bacterium]|nr:ABC transporter permease [Acidothermales bacterium]
PPQVNVIGALMFLVALAVVFGGQLASRARTRRT